MQHPLDMSMMMALKYIDNSVTKDGLHHGTEKANKFLMVHIDDEPIYGDTAIECEPPIYSSQS